MWLVIGLAALGVWGACVVSNCELHVDVRACTSHYGVECDDLMTTSHMSWSSSTDSSKIHAVIAKRVRLRTCEWMDGCTTDVTYRYSYKRGIIDHVL